MLTGTIINSLTILAGSAVGLVLRAVTRRSSKEVSADGLGGRLQTIIMQGMALCVLYIGVSGCLKGQNTLTAILSIALGAIIGELLDLDRRMRSLGDWVQTRTDRLIHTEDGAPSISDGFVTASLLFCVGAMAIVGALENGLTGSYDTLKAKSIIDGISSIVFASSLGVGVAFSAGAIFLYQGAISLLAGLLSPLLGDLGSFPPTLIQVGDHEILYSDSASLAAALRAAHVPCRLEVSEGMWHVFQMFPIKKAAAAMESAARFLLEL